MINGEKLNNKGGKRLLATLKEKKMSQVELAELTNYTVQHVNNIIRGKRNMSRDAAHEFAKVLQVDEEYLLCESDYKNLFEKVLKEMPGSASEKIDEAIFLLGYKKTKKFWTIWEGMKCCNHSNDELSDLLDHVTDEELDRSFDCNSELALELITPDNKIINCRADDYENALREICEYIKFKLEYISNQFVYDYSGKGNTFLSPEEGSITQIYDTEHYKPTFFSHSGQISDK